MTETTADVARLILAALNRTERATETEIRRWSDRISAAGARETRWLSQLEAGAAGEDGWLPETIIPRDVPELTAEQVTDLKARFLAAASGPVLVRPEPGRTAATPGPRSSPVTRYRVPVADELLRKLPEWKPAEGFRLISAEGPWPGHPDITICIFEDDAAPPDLEGKLVEPSLTRHADGSVTVTSRHVATERPLPGNVAGYKIFGRVYDPADVTIITRDAACLVCDAPYGTVHGPGCPHAGPEDGSLAAGDLVLAEVAAERDRIRVLAAQVSAACPGCEAFRAFLQDVEEP